MILGIDPGGKTGFALVQGARLFKQKTVKNIDAVSYAVSLYSVCRFDRAVIERPQIGILYAKHTTKPNAINSERGRIKLAQNIGQNIYLADELERELKARGVMVHMVRPAKRCTKWNLQYWQGIFNWQGNPPSEHARDASVIALQYENSAVWAVKKEASCHNAH